MKKLTIFDKIISKEIPAKIIYEDNKILAFYDITPKRPGHFLVIPKVKSTNLYDIKNKELSYLILKTRELALKITKEMNVEGFNLIINNGKEAKQEVLYTHIHIIPSLKK